jgi:hypothetical protein
MAFLEKERRQGELSRSAFTIVAEDGGPGG